MPMKTTITKIPEWVFTFLAAIIAVVFIIVFIYPRTPVCISDDWCLRLKSEDGIVPPVRVVQPIPIGTIISATIEPNIFTKRNRGWRLAAGEMVSPHSDFAKVAGTTKLPDLRGVFLRGMNAGITGAYSDPQNNREAGSIQEASYPSHDHSFRVVINGHPSSDNGRFGKKYGYLIHDRTLANPANRKENITTTQKGSGKDLRPTNAAVYFYIYVGEN